MLSIYRSSLIDWVLVEILYLLVFLIVISLTNFIKNQRRSFTLAELFEP